MDNWYIYWVMFVVIAGIFCSNGNYEANRDQPLCGYSAVAEWLDNATKDHHYIEHPRENCSELLLGETVGWCVSV